MLGFQCGQDPGSDSRLRDCTFGQQPNILAENQCPELQSSIRNPKLTVTTEHGEIVLKPPPGSNISGIKYSVYGGMGL